MHHSRMRRHGQLEPPRTAAQGSYGKGGRKKFYYAGKTQDEARIIAMRALGKLLPKGAIVHHVDEDPGNNTPTNLVICPDIAYHMLLHKRTKALHVREAVRKLLDDPTWHE